MNDTERKQWVDNDEGLYRMMRASRKPKRAFIRENRAFIDDVIGNVSQNRKPAHYLAYSVSRRLTAAHQ